jgi:hypothetical protein
LAWNFEFKRTAFSWLDQVTGTWQGMDGWVGCMNCIARKQALGRSLFNFLFYLYHVLMEETRMDRIGYVFLLFYAFGKRRLLAFTIE